MKFFNLGKSVVFMCMCMFIFSSSLYAQDQDTFQAELGIGYQHYKDDGTDSYEIDVTNFRSSYYFSPVSIGNHPYNEAVFLEKVSSFNMYFKGLSVHQRDDMIYYGAAFDYMSSNHPINLTFYFDRKEFDDDDVDNEYGIDVGYFISNNFLLSTFYKNIDSDYIDENQYRISSKYVHEMGTKAINLECSVAQNEKKSNGEYKRNNIVKVGGDYYFNQRISLGGGIDINSGDIKYLEGETLYSDLKVYVTETIAVSTGVEKFFAKDNYEDDNTYSINLSARF